MSEMFKEISVFYKDDGCRAEVCKNMYNSTLFVVALDQNEHIIFLEEYPDKPLDIVEGIAEDWVLNQSGVNK